MAGNLGRLVRFSRTGVSKILKSEVGVHSVRFQSLNTFSVFRQKKEEMDALKENPYFEKYADKIAKLQKTSPEEFIRRLVVVEEKKTKPKFSGKGGEPDFSLPSRPKANVDVPSMVTDRRLDDVMKVDLLKDKSAKEVAALWKEYYSSKDSVSAAIPGKIWANMKQRFLEHKTFLFPLPRKQGYEFIVAQFAGNQAHFTTLINYQAHQENAPECLTLWHFTDLLEDKDLVLMVGEFDKNTLSTLEAQCLTNQVELYYCNPSEERKKLMETFTRAPDQFNHNDLIAQIENVSLMTAAPSEVPSEVVSSS